MCVLAREDGEFVALLDRCPHRDIALSGGIVKDGALVCPGHFWRFELQSGRRRDQPDRTVEIYPTRVVDGWVEALVPPPAPRRSIRQWLLAEAAGEDHVAGPHWENGGQPLDRPRHREDHV